MRIFSNLVKRIKEKSGAYKDNLLKYLLYSASAFAFSVSVENIDPSFAFIISFLLYVFIFSNVKRMDYIMISLYSILFFLSLYGLRKLIIEERIFVSDYKIFFAFPYFTIISTLFFLIERKKAVYFCTFLCLLSIPILPEINQEFLTLPSAWFFSSLISVPMLSKSRRRFSLFKTSIVYGLFGGTLIFTMTGIIWKAVIFILSSIISPFISVSILYFFERTFNILTPFYLFDLQDIEHPILVQLRKKAPGTFHHSLVVADIAYVAAKEVGADAELIRCAALYHDIGKTARPDYFIENIGDMSAHMKINLPLSSKLVVKHVEDGEKIARSYSIPQRIIDFILEHHGTTYPEYFLRAAKRLDIHLDIRYPGPTPRSLETVIMMICDSSEAAVRSLEKYSPERIKDMVSKVVKSKIDQGQFDNSPVTLQQIKKIEESVTKALCDFYHLRISYDEKSVQRYLEKKKKFENGHDKENGHQDIKDKRQQNN